MRDYILRRLLVLIPTIFGITLVSFVLINMAPGGPIEQKIQQIRYAGGKEEQVAELLRKKFFNP